VAGFTGLVEGDKNQSEESVLSESLRLIWGELRKAIGSKGESRVIQAFKQKDPS